MPETVDDAKPPSPLVSSHSRCEAASRFEQMFDPTMIGLSSISVSALLKQLCHYARPAGLVGRADAGSIITVEVLVEEHQVVPVGVVAIESTTSVNGTG